MLGIKQQTPQTYLCLCMITLGQHDSPRERINAFQGGVFSVGDKRLPVQLQLAKLLFRQKIELKMCSCLIMQAVKAAWAVINRVLNTWLARLDTGRYCIWRVGGEKVDFTSVF